jgi:hypothetical protein
MNPNINLRLPTSIIIFGASVFYSSYTHIGWWAFGGLFYLLYALFSYEWLYIACLVISAIFFTIAILNMGWTFF